MSNYNVKITSHIDELKEELDKRVPAILEALGIEAEGNAVDEVNKLVYNTPPSQNYIRTGRLKGSITHTTDDKSAYVGTNLEYAPYVELGTYKMRPRPFLENAVNNYTDDYRRIIEDGLR